MRFTPQFLEELRERLPASEVVGRRVKLKKAGREFKGLSPFQQEKTPSFFVNDEKQAWFDFSSGLNGNIFDFVMKTEGVSFPEAVERLASMAGMALPAAYGGYEMGFSALLDTSFSIGKVCASSAWVCGLYMVHNWLGGLFPKKAQDELWGQDSGTFISGSYAPIGKATLVEGGYRLTGTKMWISGGDQDVSENIVHLVLARIDGAPAGTKGISLFIVPKKLVNKDGSLGERNDVVLAGLNHKMGYRGTTNCLLNFGEGKFMPGGEAGAIGYLVGKPGDGKQCRDT